MYHLNWRPVFQNFDLLWHGLLVGLGLAFLSLAIGSIIGILGAFARVYGSRWMRSAVAAYTEFVRNIPLLLIIYFAGFATAVYRLAPSPENSIQEQKGTASVSSAFKSGEFTNQLNIGMHKFISVAKQVSVKISEFIEEKMKEEIQTSLKDSL